MCSSVADDWPRRVAILGVGLLGGSVALAIRRAQPQSTVVGYARSKEKCELLERSGVVDAAVGSIAEACHDCDAVVVAAPVDRIAAMVIEAASHSPESCLITDVGSTKRGIVAAVSADQVAAQRFVPAHPIAGSEKSGAQHASATLFEGKVVVLTPAERADAKLVEKADHFWRLTGGQTLYLSADAHDAHLAAVSHVPHLVSALVARMADPEARSLVGSGWQDITRVAAGDPTLWTAICQENRHAIGQQLERLASELDDLRRVIDDRDDEALRSWLAAAKRMKEQNK
jgi:prephenate dehydrogenase